MADIEEKRKSGWRRLRDPLLRKRIEQRGRVLRFVRDWFAKEKFLEVEPPVLALSVGMEPHIDPLLTTVRPGVGADPIEVYHQTSPEIAMKKLLAAGFERIYSLGKVFRDGEGSAHHQIEFTMLEWYRSGADYNQVMDDTESLVAACAKALHQSTSITYQGKHIDLSHGWPRFTVNEAMKRWANIDLSKCQSDVKFRSHARDVGYGWVTDEAWEQLFFKLWISEVEPKFMDIGPLWIVDYPVRFASLAREKPQGRTVAERCEAYIGGLELSNGFSELVDADEQRKRLVQEQEAKREMKREMKNTVVPKLDEDFLDAVGHMVPSAGNALGVDRLVMLLTDASSIEDVLLFPIVQQESDNELH